MNYEVHTVADDALPSGTDHVIIERVDSPPLLILNGHPARVWAWMRKWEGTREATAEEVSVLIPSQRAPWPVAV